MVTVSSCSISKVQEKTQLSRIKCMKSLRAIQSQLKFLTDTLQDFAEFLKQRCACNQYKNCQKQRKIAHAYFRSLSFTPSTFFQKVDLKGTASNMDSNGHSCHSLVKMLYTFSRIMLSSRSNTKQLDKDEFQEDGSMTAFWVVNNQFQNFIDSKFTLDYDSQMTDTRFVQYTGIEVQHFRDTLLQHLGNVKKSVAERTRHKRQYERRVNKRQMQTQESKIDTGKALDADLVDTESIRTDSTVQDDNSRVDQYPETCQVKSHMPDSSPDNQTTEYSKQSLESENILLKKTGTGQILKETSNKAKILQRIDLYLKTMNIELEHSVATVLYSTLLPRKQKSAFAKPDHVIASSSSRNSSKNMPRFSSNDMVHNHYLDEARKKTQERDRNSKTSVMPSARFQSTADGSKPKPRSNNQTSRSLPVSKSTRVTITAVPKADHSKSSSSFSDSKQFVPSNKTTNRNKPVEQIRIAKKPERQIPTGHRFSIKKTSAVHEKTMTLRSCLRWKPTGKIFRTVGLRWVPTGKIFTPSTTKVDSEPLQNGFKCDILLYQYESAQLLCQCRASRNSNLMNKSNDVCSQQFRPQTSMSNDV
ncbi:hypothetical protein Tco_0693212 [Tanacetum coccineum]